MLAATVLTLIFVPVFYAVIERAREGRGGQGEGGAGHGTPEAAAVPVPIVPHRHAEAAE